MTRCDRCGLPCAENRHTYIRSTSARVLEVLTFCSASCMVHEVMESSVEPVGVGERF